jgi:GLTT repeat (6 copies)
VPNRRRRRLSTATSAVAALAVASPFAYIAISNLSADIKPAPQHREFVRAAEITDLPGELMGALSQGLSQFGVTIPPVPSLTGVTSPSGLAAPGLTSPGLTGPGIGSPGLTSPGLTSPGLTSPGLTSPGLTTPGLTPGLTDPSLTSPGLTSPGLTSPGLTPTGPTGFGPAGAGGLSNPSELPISDPIGLDPGAGGTYPILGDPSLGGAPSGGSGGLVGDMMSAANQLGAGQAIDLLKGMIMPGLMNAAHGAAAPAAPPPLPAPH